jgi:amidophosphoribosyltransferase
MEMVKDACGVFGIYAPGVEVAPLVFDGLFALQHRGQESAGMAVSDGETITVVKDMGLVTSVFDQRTLSSLPGHLGLGHVRYSTAGASSWENAQPVYRPMGGAGFALGHNGNLTNVAALEAARNMLPGVLGSDSELVAELLEADWPEENGAEGGGFSDADDALVTALTKVLPRLEGAFCFGLLDVGHLVAIRDPNGFRPLCLGELDPPTPDGVRGWVIASETPALDIVGARFVRELEPGEMLIINEEGVSSSFPFPEIRHDPRLCIFEFVYVSRPDTRLRDREVNAARVRMGAQLAIESTPPGGADLVIGVPDSAVPAAEGFAHESGIPFGHGLVKNRYIGRTFIAPTQQARVDAVRRKLNPLRESVDGRRLVVVDDSIVRATTSRQVVRMLREAGAAEVHLRVGSPPWRWPCFYGIDTPLREDLIGAHMEADEIAHELGADSLAYLSLEGLYTAIGVRDGWCTACLSGIYPTEVPVEFTSSLDGAVVSGPMGEHRVGSA